MYTRLLVLVLVLVFLGDRDLNEVGESEGGGGCEGSREQGRGDARLGHDAPVGCFLFDARGLGGGHDEDNGEDDADDEAHVEASPEDLHGGPVFGAPVGQGKLTGVHVHVPQPLRGWLLGFLALDFICGSARNSMILFPRMS